MSSLAEWTTKKERAGGYLSERAPTSEPEGGGKYGLLYRSEGEMGARSAVVYVWGMQACVECETCAFYVCASFCFFSHRGMHVPLHFTEGPYIALGFPNDVL